LTRFRPVEPPDTVVSLSSPLQVKTQLPQVASFFPPDRKRHAPMPACFKDSGVSVVFSQTTEQPPMECPPRLFPGLTEPPPHLFQLPLNPGVVRNIVPSFFSITPSFSRYLQDSQVTRSITQFPRIPPCVTMEMYFFLLRWSKVPFFPLIVRAGHTLASVGHVTQSCAVPPRDLRYRISQVYFLKFSFFSI